LCVCDTLQDLWFDIQLSELMGELDPEEESDNQIRVESLLKKMTVLDIDILKCKCKACGEVFTLDDIILSFIGKHEEAIRNAVIKLIDFSDIPLNTKRLTEQEVAIVAHIFDSIKEVFRFILRQQLEELQTSDPSEPFTNDIIRIETKSAEIAFKNTKRDLKWLAVSYEKFDPSSRNFKQWTYLDVILLNEFKKLSIEEISHETSIDKGTIQDIIGDYNKFKETVASCHV